MKKADKDYISECWEDFILFRINPGRDLYDGLVAIAKENGFDSGAISYLIGRANPVIVVGNDDGKEYKHETGYEILSGNGTLYRKIMHTEIKFGDVDYKANQGKLRKGTLVSELVTGMIIKGDSVPSKYLTRFEIDPDEKLYESLERLATQCGITSGGIILSSGELESVKVAFFNSKEKVYQEKVFTNSSGYLLKGGQGTLAYEGSNIKPHIHVEFQDGSQSYGGHLRECVVKKTVKGYFINVPGIRSERIDVLESASKLITFLLREQAI